MSLPCLVLKKTTTQTVATSTHTAVTWDTVSTLVGPATWADIGTSNTSIIMPWPGQYYVSLYLSWASNGTQERYIWLTAGTDISGTNNAARVISHTHWSDSSSQTGALSIVSQVITVPSAGDPYTVAVYQSTGSNLDTAARNTSEAHAWATFMYLGSTPKRTQISTQTINRSHLW